MSGGYFDSKLDQASCHSVHDRARVGLSPTNKAMLNPIVTLVDDDIDYKVNGAAMPGVLNLGDILELVKGSFDIDG